jgi:hypothetical protein
MRIVNFSSEGMTLSQQSLIYRDICPFRPSFRKDKLHPFNRTCFEIGHRILTRPSLLSFDDRTETESKLFFDLAYLYSHENRTAFVPNPQRREVVRVV